MRTSIPKAKIHGFRWLSFSLVLAIAACSKTVIPGPPGDAEGVQGDPVPAFTCVALQAGAVSKLSRAPYSQTASLYGADANTPAAVVAVYGVTLEGDVKVISGDGITLRIDSAQELNDGSYRSTLTVTGHSLDGTYDLACQVEQH